MADLKKLFIWLFGPLVAVIAVVGAEVAFARLKVQTLDEPPPFLNKSFGDGNSPALKLVIIGDSTAAGVGTTDHEQTYPWAVGEMLGEKFNVDLSVTARSGARLHDVDAEFAPEVASRSADLVFIGAGANDVTHLTSMNSVRRSLTSAIETIQASGKRVVVSLGPQFDSAIFKWPLRSLIAWRVAQLNKVISEVAVSNSADLIDLPGGLGGRFKENPARYYSPDMFHPGPQGYELWAEVIGGRLQEIALRM